MTASVDVAEGANEGDGVVSVWIAGGLDSAAGAALGRTEVVHDVSAMAIEARMAVPDRIFAKRLGRASRWDG